MKITRGLAAHQRVPHPVLTIGNFDGQHLGHGALLRDVVQRANEVGGTPMVLTFDPHPVKVLAPHVNLRFLTMPDEKLAYFKDAGIAEVLFLEFTAAFAALMPDQFMQQVLRDGVDVKDLFVGEHFAFGRSRAGRIADLIRFGRDAGFQVHPVQPLRVDGEIVSSTRIRQFIQGGDVRGAARYLGRHYALGGVVVSGEQRGQTLGWPTANLKLLPDRVVPSDGVYATKAMWGMRTFESVSYIGTRPTFRAGERLLEVSLLDAQENLYGQTIRVEFVERVRADQTFHSAEELAACIERDVRKARQALKAESQPVPGV
ncbi:MAG TPA: bifunctional riboflavin kinase/FAD synthetase [Nitrospiraceae bacterium]|nr:bifunctional riboflavin kinase/FAD synthetase [Nitrospiraceae bacterium]